MFIYMMLMLPLTLIQIKLGAERRCFNYPDSAGFAFCLQISDLVLPLDIVLLVKETPKKLLSCKSQSHCQLNGTPMLWS